MFIPPKNPTPQTASQSQSLSQPLHERREFLQAAIVTGSSLLAAGAMMGSPAWLETSLLHAVEPKPVEGKPAVKKYKKAVKLYMVQAGDTLLEKFQLLKSLGYDGIELDSPGGASAEEVKRCKGETGLEVPGVVDSVHWKDCLSDASEEVRARGLTALKEAMKMCKGPRLL